MHVNNNTKIIPFDDGSLQQNIILFAIIFVDLPKGTIFIVWIGLLDLKTGSIGIRVYFFEEIFFKSKNRFLFKINITSSMEIYRSYVLSSLFLVNLIKNIDCLFYF